MANIDCDIIDRNSAKTLGLKRYFTGIPCAHGHVTERYVNGNSCVGCHKEAYDSLSQEQKLARTRKNRIDRIKKHGKEKFDQLNNQYARKCSKKAKQTKEGRLRYSRKWQRAYRRMRPSYKLLHRAKERAQKLGLDLSIDESDIIIPEKCPALGIPLSIGNGKQHDGSPSLDRIDPNKGYIKGNVVVISLRANRIKQNATPDELVAVANWMKEYVS